MFVAHVGYGNGTFSADKALEVAEDLSSSWASWHKPGEDQTL
jgi:hypothetical protein